MPINYTLPKLTSKTSSSSVPPVSKSFITFPIPPPAVPGGNAAILPPLEVMTSTDEKNNSADSFYANLSLPSPSPLPTATDAGGHPTSLAGCGGTSTFGGAIPGAITSRRLPSPPTVGAHQINGFRDAMNGQDQIQTLIVSGRRQKTRDEGCWRNDKVALLPSASIEGEQLCLERLRYLEKLGDWQFGEVGNRMCFERRSYVVLQITFTSFLSISFQVPHLFP